MTPPGLTCARCEQPLYPTIARATEVGWTHVACDTACVTCHRGMIPDKRWRAMSRQQREEALSENLARKATNNACHACYLRSRADLRRGRSQEERRAEEARERAERMEDIEWLADTGESWEMAVIRLGLNDSTLDNFLRTHNRLDLWAKLRGSRVAA